MTPDEIMAKLQAPFKPEDLEWRVGSTNHDKTKGMALVYVTNRAIQNRLDNVFGVFGWKNEFKEWKSNSQLCGISVKVQDEWITKWDGADDSAMESVKGGLSDSMKRAAYQWGIGRYLYDFPTQWVPLKPIGKSYILAETPKVPTWALPKEYKPQSTTQPKQLDKQETKAPQKANTQQSEKKISNGQLKLLINAANKSNLSEDDLFKIANWKFKVKSLDELQFTDFTTMINNLPQLWESFLNEINKAV